jgi:hypothetical protein
MFALVIIHILRNLSALNWRQRGILTIMGLSFWVFPAVPTALSVRWQGELGRGNAYLPVFIQIIGVAFIGALVVETMTSVSKALTHFPRLRICVAGTLSLALTTVVIVNHAGANFAVNFYAGFRTDRELFETAVQSGLMNEVHDGATILSPLSDQNLWTNGVYVWWLGGPKGLNFVKPEEASTCSSQSVAWCSDSTSFTLVQAVVEDQPALVLLKVRGIPQLETNWDDVVDAWVYSRARPDSSCRSESKSHNGSASVWECAPSLALGHTLLMIS